MTGGGRATGIENKDDLRDFHQIMAVQASKEQKAAYAAMLKVTVIAGTELQTFAEQLVRPNNAPDLARRDKDLADAVEAARALTRKFIEGFSEAQKSGLKEVIKRLGKSDSELAQQARAFDQAVEARAETPQMSASAQMLERGLTSVKSAQLQLGEEMSIPTGDNQETSFNLLPVTNPVSFANQAIEIPVSVTVSKTATSDGQNNFAVRLTADLWDLQQNVTGVLRASVDQTDRCGEQISIQTATLEAREPASLVTAELHYERWSCGTMFGKNSLNEIVEGNGTVEVILTPTITDDGILNLVGKIGNVNASGLVGDLLSSGALGETLRDKITNSIRFILQEGDDFKAPLPGAARNYATLKRARFEATGSGKLRAVLDGEIVVSNENLTAVNKGLKERSSQAPERVLTPPELTSR